MRIFRRCLAILAITLSMPIAYAGTWPTRPITLVVPFTPGTGIDLIARQLAAHLPQDLGQPVVVENLAGASGNIGTEKVVRAEPDGYTFLVTVNTLVMNRSLYKDKLRFDPLSDLVPVGQTSWGSLLLVTHPSNAVKTVADVAQAAHAQPGKLTYGTPGVGTPHHLSMALFLDGINATMLHVPYKGTSGAVTDMLAGRLDYMFLPVHVALPHVQAGQLKVIATGSPKRLPQLKEVPTLKEAGLKDADVDMWYGLFAPKGTPAEVVQRMNQAINRVLENPSVATAFDAQGMVPATSSATGFGELVVRDAKRWDEVISRNGINAD